MLYDDSCVLDGRKSEALFTKAGSDSVLACRLYNAALFRIRQVFTGYDKTDRTENEKAVFEEVAKAEAECTIKGKHIHIRKVISYSHLEKLMRCTGNPDYFSGLPMQTAQAVLKEAYRTFRAWLEALKAYKANPSLFAGKPRMPKYLKKDSRHTFVLSNQDCVFYPAFDKDGKPDGVDAKFPGIKKRLRLRHISHNAVLKEAKVQPWYGKFILHFIIEDSAPPFWADMPNMAGLDLGTDNIAAIACTDGASAVCKGGAILSANRDFAKNRAKYVGILTQGHKDHGYVQTERLERISRGHDRFLYDQAHKISSRIVRFCVGHRAGVLVCGVNKGWKQGISIGKHNNQKFTAIPHHVIRQMLAYKCLMAGITYIEQEESYTSKADASAGDYIPTYGVDDSRGKHFSGERVCRGLYLCHDGRLVNADCNGAANILRKAVPDAWKCTKDFSFLARPESIGFKALDKPRKAKTA